jgi:hypothetical protein
MFGRDAISSSGSRLRASSWEDSPHYRQQEYVENVKLAVGSGCFSLYWIVTGNEKSRLTLTLPINMKKY